MRINDSVSWKDQILLESKEALSRLSQRAKPVRLRISEHRGHPDQSIVDTPIGIVDT